MFSTNSQRGDKKWCAHCRKWLPLSDFHKNKSKPDGLSTYCKVGMRKYVDESKKKNPYPRGN
jgi:hypothetical protein